MSADDGPGPLPNSTQIDRLEWLRARLSDPDWAGVMPISDRYGICRVGDDEGPVAYLRIGEDAGSRIWGVCPRCSKGPIVISDFGSYWYGRPGAGACGSCGLGFALPVSPEWDDFKKEEA